MLGFPDSRKRQFWEYSLDVEYRRLSKHLSQMVESCPLAPAAPVPQLSLTVGTINDSRFCYKRLRILARFRVFGQDLVALFYL